MVASNHAIHSNQLSNYRMRNLYINCASGASGDIFLGAFVDLGVPEEVLTGRLASLGLNEFALEINKKEINGNSVTDVDVILFNKEQAWIHPYSGKYRNYGEIKEMIDRSDMTDSAKALSKKIFDIKAKAESQVHEVPVDQVQFHEAGAVDSIVDIVGAAICVDYLKIDHIYSSAVPTGYGTVLCAVGELPVPPPAVKAILEKTGIPNYRSDVKMELLTPTGAAILSGVVDGFTETIQIPDTSHVICEGRGVGKRETGLPPLRLVLVEESEHSVEKEHVNGI